MPEFRRELEQRAVVLWAPPQIADVARIVARQAGARRIVVATGRNHLDDVLLKSEIGLVLVDEAATAPDAYALATRLNGLPAGTHRPMSILMLGAPTRRKVNEALAAGIDAVIAKPFSARALLDCVARAYAAREARRANLVNQAFLD